MVRSSAVPPELQRACSPARSGSISAARSGAEPARVRSPGWQEGARMGGVWFPLLPPCVSFPSDQPPQLVRDALPPANRPVEELSLPSRAPRLVLVLALVLSTLSACTVLPVGWTGRQAGLASCGPGFY